MAIKLVYRRPLNISLGQEDLRFTETSKKLDGFTRNTKGSAGQRHQNIFVVVSPEEPHNQSSPSFPAIQTSPLVTHSSCETTLSASLTVVGCGGQQKYHGAIA